MKVLLTFAAKSVLSCWRAGHTRPEVTMTTDTGYVAFEAISQKQQLQHDPDDRDKERRWQVHDNTLAYSTLAHSYSTLANLSEQHTVQLPRCLRAVYPYKCFDSMWMPVAAVRCMDACCCSACGLCLLCCTTGSVTLAHRRGMYGCSLCSY